MSAGGLRVLVVGATGALGSELIQALHESGFPAAALRAVASEASVGSEVELQGVEFPVEAGEPNLRGVDLAFLCAPPDVSLDWAAEALRAKVPVLDLSGALALRDEVTLGLAALHPTPVLIDAPVVATPPGPVLAWLRVLLPLHRANPITHVVATTLESVSGAGRRGIEALSEESVALFNQSEAPEPGVFPHPVAFDCVPLVGARDKEGATERERLLRGVVARALGPELRVDVTAVQVPTFAGDASVLHLRFAEPVDLDAVVQTLREAPSLLCTSEEPAPSTRSAVAGDEVRVGRVRRGTEPNTLQLWIVADSLRLAARNAVELAAARSRLH